IVGGMLVKRLLDPGEDLTSQYKNSLTAFHGKVDAFIIEAQGEQTLIRVLDSLSNGGRLEHVPNLAIFDDGRKLRFTSREQEDLPIDETTISWDKIPKAYLRKTLPVNTSRGCHFRCRFCTFRWLFPQVHYKSMAVLEKELKLINQLGFVEHIRFADDNFTGNKAKLKKVLEMMIREDFDFSWSSYARASALDPELVKMMKKAGCEFVYLGIESGSPAILKNMDKKLDRDESINAIKMLSDAGIQSRGSFIVGYPGETEETFLQTVSLIHESGLPYYIPYLFIYSKRALVHEDRDRFGLVGTGQTWKQNTMDAVEASRLMTKMIHIIPQSYNDGMTYIEEIYNLLLGKGYDHGEILELFRLKRELQLAVEELGSERPYHPKVNEILVKMESLIK
ncbi:MAG: radical SAM protein, partial [Desulfobacteraceae bacterium]